MDELQALEQWADALLAKLSPSARRTALLDIARALRRSQQTRIAAQQSPDGSAYTARKTRPTKGGKKLRDKQGRIKRNAMFMKLRTARFLKIEADGASLAVGFTGRIARIARIHQEGERAPVAPGGPEYTYPARVLLGFTEADREMIRNRLLSQLVT